MDLNYDLDVFGQQPGLSNLYTQISCCFSVADASSHTAIINTLTNGLERLSASFPWVAGQVVNEGSGEGNSGTFKIIPLERIPRLVVKDLRNDPSMPTMDALRRANFPFSMLDESIVAPRNTLPGSPDGSPSPVFLLQATFITGGLLLTFVAQHNVMDMTGQGQIIDLLSKSCCNEQFTSEELSSGNLDRRNIIPLLDDSYKPGPELAHQMVKPTPSQTISKDSNAHPESDPPSKCSWAYFTFPSHSLAALKSLATIDATLASGYISTDDALSAFIWQSIIRARQPRLKPTGEVTFARAIDPRRYLDISPTYPGIVQNMTYHKRTVQKLVEDPLGAIASELRLAVDPKTSNLGYQTRALATFLDRILDKGNASVTATINLSTDIMLSSWAKQDFYDLDFNLGLGKPEAVRRPRFTPVESLLYLMPKALDGEVAAALCLRDEDMERLRADEECARYGRYIG
ncbi:unnamed protein product [Cyclocybe aegerita]|uniref:Trichothecene 3-O-acetyltransferase-like N-terminal domain-containing protein n=1 Tax=Cyclocybe aegerita TaxID=1973307 RepID=A0A8S0VTU0_CYCAE|nr:unnamed protein product [Cyclocybe aegerita]